MSATLYTLSALAGAGWQFFDNNGLPLSGGLIYTYDAGTNTPQATYTTNTGAVANSNPIVLDSSGRPPQEVWLAYSQTYKFILKDSTGALIGSWDNINGINQSGTVNIAVSITDYGADPTGVTNSTDAINAAIAASNCVFIPEGTYLVEPTATSGDFMLYLGTAGGRPSKNGLMIFGTGNQSILKLGNNVGRAKLMFGGATGDSLADMIFRDFAIDLNGANNLQTSFSDPLRLNSAFYFFCPCNNILFDHLYIYNGSGSQWIRVGNDTSNYGANIQILNCRFNNFGIGLTNNFQQDVSVCYIQADGIVVDECWFQNSDFTFDLSRGQTALELHGVNSTVVSSNRFSFTQLPVLIASSSNPNSNVHIDNNTMIQCAYLASLDGALLDQKRITISNNIYQSTKMAGIGIIAIGNSTETAKVREEVFITGNTINCFGNTNRLVNLIYCEGAYLRSIVIQDNIVGGLLGSLIYFSGVVRDTDYCDIVIKNNRMDSLGNVGGSTFPTAPTFVFVVPTTGTINSLVIDGNVLFNSSTKNYSGLGAFRVGGNINYLYIDGTESMLSSAYPEYTTSSLTTLFQRIDADGWVRFPATPVFSTDPNVLDYYEEGTWTPTLTTSGTAFTGVTYSASTEGNYTLVGNLCTVTGLLSTDAVIIGAASGNVRISGLPFTANATAARGGIAVTGSNSWATDNPTGGDVQDSNVYINLNKRATSVSGSTSLVVADVSSSPSANIIAFTAMYYI